MTHYVLLKLIPGADLDAAEKLVRETYARLEETLPYLKNPVVTRNCIDRDSNADIMVSLQLDSEEQLQPYLTHPLHLQMAQDMQPYMAGRTSFDHV